MYSKFFLFKYRVAVESTARCGGRYSRGIWISRKWRDVDHMQAEIIILTSHHVWQGHWGPNCLFLCCTNPSFSNLSQSCLQILSPVQNTAFIMRFTPSWSQFGPTIHSLTATSPLDGHYCQTTHQRCTSYIFSYNQESRVFAFPFLIHARPIL